MKLCFFPLHFSLSSASLARPSYRDTTARAASSASKAAAGTLALRMSLRMMSTAPWRSAIKDAARYLARTAEAATPATMANTTARWIATGSCL